MHVLVRPQARTEILEAQAWYESRAVGLGLEFARAVDAAVSSAVRNPEAFPSVAGRCRRVLLRRFPVSLVYRVREGCVPHGNRLPPSAEPVRVGTPHWGLTTGSTRSRRESRVGIPVEPSEGADGQGAARSPRPARLGGAVQDANFPDPDDQAAVQVGGQSQLTIRRRTTGSSTSTGSSATSSYERASMSTSSSTAMRAAGSTTTSGRWRAARSTVRC